MKKKFNLNDLKVKSFVTSMEGTEEQTVKGGTFLGCGGGGIGTTIGPLPGTNNTTCCLHTKVDAICKGWHTMPYWDGCGSI